MTENKYPCMLLINDIHVSKDNIPEFIKNWDEAIDICLSHKITNIVIGGDLFQSRSSQTLSVLMAVRQALFLANNNNIQVVIAEGNHDKVDQESILGYSHIFSDYDGVVIVDDYVLQPIGDESNIVLCTMSYFPETGGFKEKMSQAIAQIPSDQKAILYCHEGIQGSLGGMKLDSELPQEIFDPFDKVLVGHYHNRCKIKGTNIEYIGSSRQHNFGEDEEKGYTILYSDGSTEFVKNKVNTRYRNIEVTSKKLDTKFYDMLDDLSSDGRYKIKVKVSCSTTEASQINKQSLLDSGATKVEIVTEDMEVKESEAKGMDTKFDKKGIKTEYTVFCSEKEIKDVEFGLSYLDKID